MKKKESINEFELMIYEKDCNNFTIKLLWIWVVIQMIGFVFCLFTDVFPMNTPWDFLLNSFLFVLTALFINYIKKRYHNLKFFKYIKYIIISSIFILCYVLISTYNTDVMIQFVWIMPVAMSVLYLDKKIMIFSILNGIGGLIIMQIIMLVEKSYSYNSDLHGTSLMFFVIFNIIFYMLFHVIHKIKFGVDNTLTSVIYGTRIINHSVKNQISTVALYVENYRKIFSEKGISQEGLDIMEEAINYLNDIITRIQTYLKNPILEKSKVNLSEILNSCLDFLDVNLKQKKVRVLKEYEENIILSCDFILIKEMIVNLMLNSIESFNKDDNKLKIEVHKGLRNLRINIIDNGCGIPKEILPRIIDPHFSTKDRTNNFGIGLTHCFKIIKEHGGFFDVVYTEVNKGTNIEVVLPLS